MDIQIRTAKLEDYNAVEAIMKQVHKLHVGWRPDVYKQQETILPLDEFKQAIQEQAFFVAEGEGKVVGILGLMYRHVETPVHVTKDIIFIDSMAVDEPYRKKGVGHAFFDFLKESHPAFIVRISSEGAENSDRNCTCGFIELLPIIVRNPFVAPKTAEY